MKQDLNIEQKINKKAETWGDKITKFFDRIEFLDLEGEKKQEVAINVKKDAVGDKLYWIEIFLSGVIASLGLLQNSVAVVIGAMLIAPLLRPINGISFSIAKGERSFFWASVNVMFVSSLFAILTGFIAHKLYGLEIENSEIIARTSPNIIDLFIAIFSAIVAVLSLGFARLGESIAGVAMAAALLPPLSVVGIELSMGNYALALGAFTLYGANLIAIIFIGTIVFWLYGFTPHNGHKQKSVVKRFIFVVIVIFLISLPLIHSLFVMKEKRYVNLESRNYLESLLKQETDKFSISELEVKSVNSDGISIFAVIKIPEGLNFYDTFKKQLDFELSKKFGKKVELDIELIRTATIISSEKKLDLNSNIYDFLVKDIENNFKNINVLSIEIDNDNLEYTIKIIMGVGEDGLINEQLLDGLKNRFTQNYDLQSKFVFIPLKEYESKTSKQLTQSEKLKKELKNSLEGFIYDNVGKNIKLRSIDYKINGIYDDIEVDLYFEFNMDYDKEFLAFIKKINKFKDEKLNYIDLNINYDIYKQYNNK